MVAAFGFSVAKKRGEKIFLDRTGYQNETLRHYELDQYNLDHFLGGPCCPGHTKVYKEKSPAFDPEVYKTDCNVFEGYWQNEEYFDKKLVSSLFGVPRGTPNEKCMEVGNRILDAKDSCFIGVRRADYLWPERINYHGVMSADYYCLANLQLPVNLDREYFIFTDDIPWAKENLPKFMSIVDVNGPNEKAWDIWLMSLCKHAIIANSSFHWWGCFLGADVNGGTIIAPKKWYADEKVNAECSIVPERWVRI